METELQNQEEALFYSIEELLSNDRIQEASLLLDLIPHDSPHFSRALLFKAVVLGMLGDEEESLEDIKKSVTSQFGNEVANLERSPPIDVSDPKDLFDCGLNNFYFGDYERAIDYFDLSLRKLPKQSEVIYYKALSYGCLGNYRKAIRTISKAIDLNPDKSSYWNDKGAFLSEINQVSKAHKCFDKSISLHPSSFNWSNKAVLYHKCGDLAKAMECYDNAIELDREDIYPVVGKAKVYMELEDFKSAEECFDLAESIDENDMEYLIERGKYMIFTEDYQKAIKYFDRCLKFDNTLAFVWMFKSMALKQLRRFREANMCVENAVELDPNILDTFDELF